MFSFFSKKKKEEEKGKKSQQAEAKNGFEISFPARHATFADPWRALWWERVDALRVEYHLFRISTKVQTESLPVSVCSITEATAYLYLAAAAAAEKVDTRWEVVVRVAMWWNKRSRSWTTPEQEKRIQQSQEARWYHKTHRRGRYLDNAPAFYPWYVTLSRFWDRDKKTLSSSNLPVFFSMFSSFSWLETQTARAQASDRAAHGWTQRF